MKNNAITLILALATFSLCHCGSSGNASSEAATAESLQQSAAVTSQQPLDSAILAEVNRYRASKGKPAVSSNALLAKLSGQHSAYMAKTGDFGHQGFAARAQTAQASKISPLVENVAKRAQPTSATTIVQSWIDSRHHRKNMLGKYNTAGVAHKSQNGQTYVTLMIGSQ